MSLVVFGTGDKALCATSTFGGSASSLRLGRLQSVVAGGVDFPEASPSSSFPTTASPPRIVDFLFRWAREVRRLVRAGDLSLRSAWGGCSLLIVEALTFRGTSDFLHSDNF